MYGLDNMTGWTPMLGMAWQTTFCLSPVDGTDCQRVVTDCRLCCCISAEGMLPMWAGAALRECLRLHRHSDDNVLSVIGLALDQERFHIIYPHMQNRTLKDHIVDSKKVGESGFLLLDKIKKIENRDDC